MPYRQFVEVGRLALISFGPLADSLAIIVDIVDATRVLIDIWAGTEGRQVISIKRLKLTDIVIEIPRAAAPEVVAQALIEGGAITKWNSTKWAKRIELAKAKSDLNDFQRFKYAKLVDKRKALVTAALAKASGGKGGGGGGKAGGGGKKK